MDDFQPKRAYKARAYNEKSVYDNDDNLVTSTVPISSVKKTYTSYNGYRNHMVNDRNDKDDKIDKYTRNPLYHTRN